MAEMANMAGTIPGQAVIEASDLVKQFGDARALDGLDLTVRKGESFGRLGANG
jgi:ABC-type multidrug transport system ATPase subunit